MADESPAPTLTVQDLATAVATALATVNAKRAELSAWIAATYPGLDIPLPAVDLPAFTRFLVNSIDQMATVEIDAQIAKANDAVARAQRDATGRAQALTAIAGKIRATFAA